MAIDKWRSYLQNQEFIIKTDHKSFLHFSEQRVTTKLQQKALLKLMDLQYKIVYKQGPTNQAIDALSRCYPAEVVAPITLCQPVSVEKVKEGYASDVKARELLTKLEAAGGTLGAFTLAEGVIRFHGRIWLGTNKLMEAINNSGIGGHSGFAATYYRVKKLFSWDGMEIVIQKFTAAVCQQAKVQHSRPIGLLQPLPIPEQAWQTVCLDFVKGLPKANKFDTILVVIDKFIKYLLVQYGSSYLGGILKHKIKNIYFPFLKFA